MTDRQLRAELIGDVLGIDPHAPTAAQFERAADAAYGTERGAELSDEMIRTMSDDEIADGIIWHRFGLGRTASRRSSGRG